MEDTSLIGLTFNVVSVDAQPFMAQAKEKFGFAQITGGLFGSIFSIISEELQFRYNLAVLHGYRYGAFRNGRWDGMIGHLTRDEMDISASELSMTEDRLSLIDFSMSFDSVGRKIYVRKILQEKVLDWSFYFAPFSLNLHFMVIFWLCSMAIILWTMEKYPPTKQLRLSAINQDEMAIKESFWIAFSSLCQKGAHILPNTRSSKIAFLVFYVTFLIIYCAYSATLISQLSATPPVTIPFKDLSDFVTKSKGWKGGPIKGDLMQIYMEKSCPTLLQKGANAQCELLVSLWTKVVEAEKDKLPTSFGEGLKRVLQERFAFIAAGPGSRYFINNHFTRKDACNIFEMDGDYISSNLAFGFRKSFPFKRAINHKILQLQTSGIIKRLRKIWYPQFQECINFSASSNFQVAGIQDVGVAPLIWFLGGFFSFVIWLWEIVVFKCNVTKERKHAGENNININEYLRQHAIVQNDNYYQVGFPKFYIKD